jgi:hypothetical protein
MLLKMSLTFLPVHVIDSGVIYLRLNKFCADCKIRDTLEWRRKDESSALPDDLDYPASRNGPRISYQFIVNFLHNAP